MTVQLLPLEQLNAAQKVAELDSLKQKANSYANMGAPVLPGIPDIKQMIKDLINNQVSALTDEVKKRIKNLLIAAAAGLSVAASIQINKVIAALNVIIILDHPNM